MVNINLKKIVRQREVLDLLDSLSQGCNTEINIWTNDNNLIYGQLNDNLGDKAEIKLYEQVLG